ncbi:peroxidase [Sphaerisporangium album]|uniref:Peroxidase n=1 Tax=Sphaerisporangium album TaxID=509200 RepID=A0A367FHB3_9ACTN|nr:peroxidase [Sphaerisporangium album]RCG29711.1 peroxidase [Sphaerisporangium album]
MPVQLSNGKPLVWDSAALDADTRAMLDNLQPNILQAHVREHLAVLFLQFGDGAGGRRFLREVAALMKSARRHFEEVRAFNASKAPGTPYVGVGISRLGYNKLGHDTVKFTDNAFKSGLKRRKDTLSDPPVSAWEASYREEIHAVVLIGDATPGPVAATRARVLALLPKTAKVVGEETGNGLRDAQGRGIEHFGYVDGRSQPLFLADQVAAERGVNWTPFFPLSHILVSDPLAPKPERHFGSYLVFRKLEQNVRAFREAEERLADALGLTGADRPLAGAMLVGRFRNGTPLRLHGRPSSDGFAVQNDFSYRDDPGSKCPVSAHIRKTNPRDSRDGGLERVLGVMMARRGQTYGTRTDVPWDDAPPQNRPTGGVGLLFMAFNASLQAQFEFTQQAWADSPGFPVDGTGHDPVIGQGEREGKVRFPQAWGSEKRSAPQAQVPQTVTMKGGEYFFMPSLAYLKGLKDR